MVLNDHIRKGKKLIPPLMAKTTPPQQTNWRIERLPELFWLALLSQRVGNANAMELAFQMTQAIQLSVSSARANENVVRAYLMSEHLSFLEAERQQINAEHEGCDWLVELRPLFSDMALIWPELPTSYLVQRKGATRKTPLVREVKRVLTQCLHRHDKLSLMIQAIAVATEFRTGHTTFAQGLRIPNLNAIADYPDTDESKHAAGFVVTNTSNMIMCRGGPDQSPDFTWQRQFWSCCYRLEPCEYD